MDEIAKRARRAAERILEDERLTDNLEDDAARILIDWGIALAESIARESVDEQTMHDRLKAVRRLMRYVNKWLPRRTETDAESNLDYVAKIVEQATMAYGEQARPTASPEIREAFITEFAAPSTPAARAVEILRAFIENRYSSPTENSEERYGQEIYF